MELFESFNVSYPELCDANTGWRGVGGTHKLGDQLGAALESELMDLGLVLVLGSLLGRHGGGWEMKRATMAECGRKIVYFWVRVPWLRGEMGGYPERGLGSPVTERP